MATISVVVRDSLSLHPPLQEMSGPVCILCEFVMKELESMLDSNSTEAEIKAALDKVCSILPSSIKEDVSPVVMCTCKRVPLA